MTVVRNLVEYYGITDYLPDENVNFTQINIEDEVSPTINNIFLKEVCKVYCRANINKVKILNTLQGQSLEGVNLTGKKALVAGEASYKIEFIANNEINSIHTINHSVPFATSVVIPNYIMEEHLINPEVFIEDVNVSQLDNNLIYLSSLLLIAIEQ